MQLQKRRLSIQFSERLQQILVWDTAQGIVTISVILKFRKPWLYDLSSVDNFTIKTKFLIGITLADHGVHFHEVHLRNFASGKINYRFGESTMFFIYIFVL